MTTGRTNARGARVVAALLLAACVSPAMARGAAAGTPGGSWTGAGQGGEILAEVRVHGNYATPDAEVLRIAQLTIGQPVTASSLDQARVRLESSGRFLAAEIRKRYRSIEPNADVALIIIVREYPVPEDTPAPLRPLRRIAGSGMFLPILRFDDGYGFTYGARVSLVDGLGSGGRISVPLTWGGDKAVRVEFGRNIPFAPFDRLTASASLSRRTNPHFEIDDDRREVSVGASRQIGKAVRAGLRAGLSHIGFGAQTDRMTSYGGHVSLDTRQDPGFPRNAVHVEGSIERLVFRGGPGLNRYRLDARGYVGLVGQTVLAVRGLVGAADGPLPDSERFLLGGWSSLRGYRAGTFIGDTVAAGTLELRIPLGSAMSVAHYGVTAFADAGAVADHGKALADARFRTGFGGGVFVLATVFHLKVDVGVNGERGARVHLATAIQF